MENHAPINDDMLLYNASIILQTAARLLVAATRFRLSG